MPLPEKITVVHRSDGSGTPSPSPTPSPTFSQLWKSKVGEGKAVSGPFAWAAKGTEGVSGVIQNTPGSIATSTRLSVKGKIKAAGRSRTKAGKFRASQPQEWGPRALNNIQLNSMPGWGKNQPRPGS